MNEWNPAVDAEPSGWNRHPYSNRYRIACDPDREFNPEDGPPPGFQHPWNLERGWTPIKE